MDLSAERSTAPVDFQQPGKVTPVRRKLVQSTLFPNSKKRRLFEDENRKIDEVGDEALKRCSDDKSVKKTNKRNSSKPKATPRASKQIAVNGKGMTKETEDGSCPDTQESDITPKKNHEEEHSCISPENEKSCMSPISPISTRAKRREKRRTKYETPPKANGIRNLSKSPLFMNTPHELALDEPRLPVIPDLRSEAKLTAEENSRLFAGKPLHPFFSSCKAIKKTQEIIEVVSSQCSLESREEVIPLRPFHVLQAAEGDAESLDWGQWEFTKGIWPSTHSGLGSDCSSFFERSVSSLQIDDLTTNSCPIETFMCQNKDKEVDAIGSTQTSFNCMSSATEFQHKFLPKGSYTQVENSLWTDKYQPRYASQICGNSESVKFISEWLYYWHKKNWQTSFEDEKSASLADSYGLSGSDSESCDDDTSVKNVLLITGPVGSGKSAAIYACAQEQGFQVIEVNASDWRNGALVKQRFGEALESHRHKNKIDSKSPAKSLFGITAATKGFEDKIQTVTLSNEENSQACGTPSMYSTEKENGDLTDQSEIKTLILFEDVDATLSEDHGFLSTIQQLALTAKRPMILTSNEDGSVLPKNLERLAVPFEIPSVKELLGLGRVVCDAENANIHPCLIDRCVEYFQGDIRKTILHLQFWCQGQTLKKGSASGITYSPLLFDLEAGHHILPKLIPLGFPSPLSEYVEEEIAKSSITVEKHHSSQEVVTEQDFVNLEIINGSVMDGNEFNDLQTKKRAMLSLSNFYGEEELLTQPECIPECSDSYSSPVAFAKRNGRRKNCAIMSSDSEEEANGNLLGVTASPEPSISFETLCGLSTEQNCHNEEACQEEQKSGKRCKTSFHTSILEDCNSADISIVPESVFIPGAEALFPATVSYNPFCFTDADSINSLFPNLSAVNSELVCEPFQKNPEMPARIDDIGETNLSAVNSELVCEPFQKNPEMLARIDDIGETMMQMQGDQVRTSQIEHDDNVLREYSVLDECSRFDFATLGNPITENSGFDLGNNVEETWRNNNTTENSGFDLGCNVEETWRSDNTTGNSGFDLGCNVEETWKRLRECHADLQQLVTPEYKDSLQAMKLSFRMSNLISESDLLHIHSQSDADDPIVSSRWHDEVMHSYRWYDDQAEMSSVVAQHGLCSYAKEADALVAKSNGSCCGSRLNLAWEMLSSSLNPMALGKLLCLNKVKTENSDKSAQLKSYLGKLLCLNKVKTENSDTSAQLKSYLERRKTQSSLRSLCRSVVSPKTYLALEGDAFYEYFSTLSQISRCESVRLSQPIVEKKRRRSRGSQHYLSSGNYMLSPQDISMLDELNCLQKSASQCRDS